VDAIIEDLRARLPIETQAYLPSETLLASIILAGVLFLGIAFLWALVKLLRHGGRGWTRTLLLLLVLPIVIAGLFVALFAFRDWQPLPSAAIAGFLILAFLASVAILVLAVVVGSFARFSTTRGAVILGMLGTLLIAGPIVYNKVIEPIILARNRPIWVTQDDGKLQVTVTNIPNFDYDQLKPYENADVLQMANPDVTDDTLHKIENFKLLTELDLNNTQITDKGLAILRSCASLKTLRIANTKITDAGFREFILPRDWIKEVDVRNTPVDRKTTLKEWMTQGHALGLERKYLK
jgi:hypothetical protein